MLVLLLWLLLFFGVGANSEGPKPVKIGVDTCVIWNDVTADQEHKH